MLAGELEEVVLEEEDARDVVVPFEDVVLLVEVLPPVDVDSVLDDDFPLEMVSLVGGGVVLSVVVCLEAEVVTFAVVDCFGDALLSPVVVVLSFTTCRLLKAIS